MKRLLCLVALAVVATLAFTSVAMAQQAGGEDGPCPQPSFGFFPDVGGCLVVEPLTLVALLNAPLVDPDTGEELGILKNLDPDLSSGDFSISYQEFCGDFPQPESLIVGTTLGGLTAQEYYDQLANAKEQAILDTNGDGLACTSEDAAFLAGDTGAVGAGGASGDADQYGSSTDEAPPSTMPTTPDRSGTGGGGESETSDDDEIPVLPATGGASLFVLAGCVLLVAGGLVARRTFR